MTENCAGWTMSFCVCLCSIKIKSIKIKISAINGSISGLFIFKQNFPLYKKWQLNHLQSLFNSQSSTFRKKTDLLINIQKDNRSPIYTAHSWCDANTAQTSQDVMSDASYNPRQPEQNQAAPEMTYNHILHRTHSEDWPRKTEKLNDFGKKPHKYVTKMTIHWGSLKINICIDNIYIYVIQTSQVHFSCVLQHPYPSYRLQ